MTDTSSHEGPQCPHCACQITADDPVYYDEFNYTSQECPNCKKTYNVAVDVSATWHCWEKE